MNVTTAISDEYTRYETRFSHGYERKTLDGKIVGCSKCVAYCKYDGHPGFITDKIREEHNCREKGCFYFVPKPRRARMKSQRDDIASWILHTATVATSDYEGLKVTGVSVQADGECTLRYVALATYPIQEIEDKLTTELCVPVKMRKIDCDYEIAADIIFS